MAGPFLVFFSTSPPSDGMAFAPLSHGAGCLGGCFFFIFSPSPSGMRIKLHPTFGRGRPGADLLRFLQQKKKGDHPRDPLGTHPASRGRSAATGDGSGAAGDGGGRQQGPRTSSHFPPTPQPCPARPDTLTAAFPSWLALGHGGKFGGGGGGAPRMSGGGTGRDAAGGRGQAGGDRRDAAPPRKAAGRGLRAAAPGCSFPGRQRPERCRREREGVGGKKG